MCRFCVTTFLLSFVQDPEQTTQAACQWDATNTCSSPTVKSEVSEHSLTGKKCYICAILEMRRNLFITVSLHLNTDFYFVGFPASPDQASGSVHTQQKVLNIHSNKE